MVAAPDSALLRLAFDGDPEAPRRVRRAFMAEFPEHECLEVMLLCLSEVVTNVVLHAETGGTVAVSRVDDVLRVEVSDGSPAPPVRRHFRELSATGRGLHLLDRLSHRWGVEHVPGRGGGGGGGKIVWFEVRSGRTA
jgi:anti-sigma regulatory factor (Ser/Thr protein kinase)